MGGKPEVMRILVILGKSTSTGMVLTHQESLSGRVWNSNAQSADPDEQAYGVGRVGGEATHYLRYSYENSMMNTLKLNMYV